MRAPLLLAAVSAALSAPTAARADDWSQFQGPGRNAVSAETGLVRTFPAGGPPVVWTTPLGPGYGGAAIRDGELFLMDREPNAEILRCLDPSSGDEKWRFAYETRGRMNYDGSRSTPTVTADRVYTAGTFGHVHCIDRTTHRPVWSIDLVGEMNGVVPDFGYTQSPLLHGGHVIVAALASDAGLVALDPRTGAVTWRSPYLGTSHSNPVPMTLAGREQLVFASREGEVGMITGLDPATGAVLWQTNEFWAKRNITAPTAIDGDRVFITAGYRAGSLMLRVTKQRDGYGIETVFKTPRGSQIHQPILVGEHLYVLANENWNDKRKSEGGLMCLDLEGHERWRTGDDPYLGRGAILLADGMLVSQDGYSGTIRLIDPRPDGLHVLATHNLFGVRDEKDHRMWAPLALSDGRLFLRSQDELKCVDLRSQPAAD